MLIPWFLPPACLHLQAGLPWTEALESLRDHLPQGAVGCLVYLERLDASSLRVRLVAQGTRFQALEGEPMGFERYAFRSRAPQGTTDLRLVTYVPEGCATLRIRLLGQDFAPEVVLPLPKVGEASGTVLQGSAGE